jgi:hypothetical protein
VSVVIETTAAVASTMADNLFLILLRRGKEDREQRQSSAGQLVAALSPIVHELRMFEDRRRPKWWKKNLRRLYALLDDLEPELPTQWRHLKRSIRDSVGSAVGGGVVFVDLVPVPDDADLSQPSRWTMHAADYLDGCQRSMRRWGHLRSVRGARCVTIPDFSTWVDAHNLQD